MQSLRGAQRRVNPVSPSAKTLDCFALLMKPLAIPLGEQTTLTKWLVVAMTTQLELRGGTWQSRTPFKSKHWIAAALQASQ
jgi:hypothetical protein